MRKWQNQDIYQLISSADCCSKCYTDDDHLGIFSCGRNGFHLTVSMRNYFRDRLSYSELRETSGETRQEIMTYVRNKMTISDNS